jgi:AhpD family alkylhydroperoxidase
MSRSKRNGELNTELIEKVMLTVTEINGCEVCSVFHNRVAEKEEIKEEDIQVLFVADFEEIPQDEAPAILFARRYAASSGKASEHSWKSLIQSYGESKADPLKVAVSGTRSVCFSLSSSSSRWRRHTPCSPVFSISP